MQTRFALHNWCALMIAFVLAVAASACSDDEDACAGLAGACDQEGLTRCSVDSTAVETCSNNTDGCLVWSASACNNGETCDDSGGTPACVAGCSDECATDDYPACSADETAIETCVMQADGCTDLVSTACGAGEVCDDSGAEPVCVTPCSDECATDDYPACSADETAIETCVMQADGCTDLVSTACGAGEVCDDSGAEPVCVTPCSDECATDDYPACSDDGAAIETCVMQADGCTDVISTACGAGEECDDSGAEPVCVTPCSDECATDDYPACSDDETAIETCVEQADGCTDLVSTACGAGEVCDDSGGAPACIVPCSDECATDDYPACSADDTAIETCVEQADGCTDLVSTACSAGEVCDDSGGAPVCIDHPHGTVDPAGGSPVGTSQVIVATFDRSMDPATLTLGGDIGAADVVWSAGAASNDTLTISPQSSWTVGWSRALDIDVQEQGGPESVSLALEYDVFDVSVLTYLYVDAANGNDTDNDGLSPDAPKQTIPAAVDAASDPSAVLVAGGTYPVNSDPAVATHIVLAEGVSLYGGYAPGFAYRDTEAYPAQVTDQCTVTGLNNNAMLAPNGSGVTNATVVDGFSIQGGGGTASSAIRTDNASPTFRHNILHGGSAEYTHAVHAGNGSTTLIQENVLYAGDAGNQAWGVYSEQSAITIERNFVDGGTADSSTIGLYLHNANGDSVRNNVVNGGAATTTAGIQAGGVVHVANNTIGGGTASWVAMAMAYDNGEVTVENNIMFSGAGGYNVCFSEWQQELNEGSFHNNNLFDCDDALYVDKVSGAGDCSFIAGSDCLTDIASVNGVAGVAGGSGDNVSVDPVFANPAGGDYHLSATSPQSVSEGGLDLSAFFGDDMDRAPRTVPWSMGAYEQD